MAVTRDARRTPVKREARTIDEFMRGLSAEKRAAMERLRRTIQAAAPRAEECIAYGVPAFRLGGKFLVGFGAGVSHCSFYPGGTALALVRRGTRALRHEHGHHQVSAGPGTACRADSEDREIPRARARRVADTPEIGGGLNGCSHRTTPPHAVSPTRRRSPAVPRTRGRRSRRLGPRAVRSNVRGGRATITRPPPAHRPADDRPAPGRLPGCGRQPRHPHAASRRHRRGRRLFRRG